MIKTMETDRKHFLGNGGNGDVCINHEDCQNDLFCTDSYRTNPRKVCRFKVEEGEWCDKDLNGADCKRDMECVGPTNLDKYYCRKVVKLDHNPNLKYFALFTRDFMTVFNDEFPFKDLQFDSKGILSQSEKYILNDCNSNWCRAARGHSKYEWKLYNGKYLLKDYDNHNTAHIPNKYEKDFYIDLNKKITYKGYDYYIGKSLKGVYITKDMFLFITTRPAEDFLTKYKIFGQRRLRIEEIIKPLYYELNKTNPSEKALDDILSKIDK